MATPKKAAPEVTVWTRTQNHTNGSLNWNYSDGDYMAIITIAPELKPEQTGASYSRQDGSYVILYRNSIVTVCQYAPIYNPSECINTIETIINSHRDGKIVTHSGDIFAPISEA
jgi:hypothetical protein